MTRERVEQALTPKQLQVLTMWAAEYQKLGNDPTAAPDLSAESRKWKLVFADALTAALADRARLLAENARLEEVHERSAEAWREAVNIAVKRADAAEARARDAESKLAGVCDDAKHTEQALAAAEARVQVLAREMAALDEYIKGKRVEPELLPDFLCHVRAALTPPPSERKTP